MLTNNFAKELGVTDIDLLGIYLDELIKMISEKGYDVRATWDDEYGGPQSVTGGIKLSLHKKDGV